MAISVIDMTREEAQVKHNTLKHLHTDARALLLEIRDRNGWKALGFKSFEEYGEKEWGYSRTYINRLAKAEEIQKSLSVPIGTELPESQLRPLAVVPEAERQAIYAEAKRKADDENQALTAKKIQDAVEEWKRKADDHEKAYKSQLKTMEKRFDEIETLKQELASANQQIEEVNEISDKEFWKLKDQIAAKEKELADLQQKFQQQASSTEIKPLSDALRCHASDNCQNMNNGFDVFNPHLHKTVWLCPAHYARMKKGVDVFLPIEPMSTAEVIASVGFRTEPVYDDVLVLNVNEYYGHLADSLIHGLNEAVTNLIDFNQTTLKGDYQPKLKEILNIGNRDRLAQAVTLLNDTAQSLEFLLTGKSGEIK